MRLSRDEDVPPAADAIPVSSSRPLAASLPRAAIPTRMARLAALVQALRIHQWSKNLLIFVPTVLAHRLLDPPAMTQAFLAFAAFCCAASGAYVVNDLFDLEADRWHPLRRRRPFAAGILSPTAGWAFAALLFVTALLLAWTLPMRFLGVLALYVVLTTAYSLRLKRIPVLDVILLAGFYTLRMLAGAVATDVNFSTWLLAFSTFLFLSLAFVKRYGELAHLRADGETSVPRRGYVTSDREWMGSMGSASGYMSVLVLALYISSDEVVALYGRPMALWLLCPIVLYWISRVWLLAHRGLMHDDPIVATLRDPLSYALGLAVAGVLLAAL